MRRNYEMNIVHTRFLSDAVSQLMCFIRILFVTDKLRFLAGIPNVYYFGQEGLHNILVIDLLGPSLEDLFDHCNRRFTIKTVVMVAKQMVIRPRNFMSQLRAGTKLDSSSPECKPFTRRISSTEISSPTTSSSVVLGPKPRMLFTSLTLVWPNSTETRRQNNIFRIESESPCPELPDT